MALSMAARSCIRVGTGLVTAATWEDSFDHLMGELDDEIMCMAVSFDEKIAQEYKSQISMYSSVCVGQGKEV